MSKTLEKNLIFLSEQIFFTCKISFLASLPLKLKSHEQTEKFNFDFINKDNKTIESTPPLTASKNFILGVFNLLSSINVLKYCQTYKRLIKNGYGI